MGILNYNDACQCAQQHKLIHHYTTFKALESIIGNHSLRLSRIDRLNDTVENSRILDLWKSKVFVSCFTHCDHESYFFWRTYTDRSLDGIMISVQTLALTDLTLHADEKCEQEPLSNCTRTNLNSSFSPKLSAESWGIYDYSCVDISYVSRNESIDEEDSFQGRIKYNEWDMEQETRLRVAVRPTCLEIMSEGGTIKYCTPEDEYIYAKLSNACLNSLKITLSPFANQELRKKVKQLLKKNGLSDVQIVESTLTGELNSPKR